MEINISDKITMAATPPSSGAPVTASSGRTPVGVNQITATSNITLTTSGPPSVLTTTRAFELSQTNVAEYQLPQPERFSFTSKNTTTIQRQNIPHLPQPQAGPIDLSISRTKAGPEKGSPRDVRIYKKKQKCLAPARVMPPRYPLSQAQPPSTSWPVCHHRWRQCWLEIQCHQPQAIPQKYR